LTGLVGIAAEPPAGAYGLVAVTGGDEIEPNTSKTSTMSCLAGGNVEVNVVGLVFGVGSKVGDILSNT